MQNIPPLVLDAPPQRIVSLVPSLTESLVDLGMSAALVGITDYCILPQGQLMHLPRLGGTKNPRPAEIIALRPDLVLANREENTPAVVSALEQAGILVWLTFPQTVRESLALLWELAHIFESKLAVQRLDALERSLEWAQAAAMDLQRVRYFCPIWQDKTASGQPWWMTFNRRTYSHDLLEILGGENIARDRERRYPLEADLGLAAVEAPAGRDTRYPRMTMEEIRAGEPELVLLPDEPYPFQETHRLEWLEALAGCPVVEKERIHCIAGSLVTWHGTRLARALEELPLLIMKG